MKCHKCIEQLSAYSDHMLTGEEQKEVEMHLKVCPSCREELDVLTEMLNKISTLQDVEVPDMLHAGIMKRIYKDKEVREKNSHLKRWMKYSVSIAAALFIVVILIDQSQIVNYKKSESAQTESAAEARMQENIMVADETINSEYKTAQAPDSLENTDEQSIGILQSREIQEELLEVWEVITPEKEKVLELIKEYIGNYELQYQYLLGEVPGKIIIYQIQNKEELFNKIIQINSVTKINKKELQGEDLEIIIK